MTFSRRFDARFRILILALLVAVPVLPGTAKALPVVYDMTLGTTPAAVATPLAPGNFANCVAAEGCFATAGLNDVAGGNMPDTFTFAFPFSAAEIGLITGSPVVATLSVVASRDVGIRTTIPPTATATEVLVTSADGTALGNLFQTTTSTCPAGERGGPGYPADLNCGPNFHTDVTATDSLLVTNIVAAVADGTLNIVLDPPTGGGAGNNLGRLKIFSVNLQVEQVPEPSVFALLVLALSGVAAFYRSRTK
jgi:hypothetical protein